MNVRKWNNRNKAWLFLLLMTVLMGCRSAVSSTPKTDAIQAIVIDPDSVDANFDLSTILEDSIVIISLETNDSCLIARVSRVELTDDYIVISDEISQKVFLFDSGGSYLKTIGKRGVGPGEYSRLGDFAIIGDSIFIQDAAARKYIVYHMKNNTYEEHFLNLSYMDILSFGNILYLFSDNLTSSEGNYNLFKYDLQTDEIIDRGFPFQETDDIWAFRRHASRCGDNALFIYPMNDTIYKVNKDEYYPAYTVQFTSRNLPEELVIKPGSNLFRTVHQNKYLKGLENVQNSSRFLLGIYSDGAEFRYLCFDKESHMQQVARQCVLGCLGDLYCYDFCTTSDNELIIVQSAGTLLANWKSTVCKDYIAKTKIDKLMANINEDSNPVLFKYKIKK